MTATLAALGGRNQDIKAVLPDFFTSIQVLGDPATG